MRIDDITDAVDDGQRGELSLDRVTVLAVHRVGKDFDRAVSLGDTAEEICRAFLDGPAAIYTGRELPYHFVIEASGRVAQCLPLEEVGRHARRWNAAAIGVACIGDFRACPPEPMQREALVELLAGLCLGLNLIARSVKGHDELAGGSAHPSKRCPGRHLDLAMLRSDVAGRMLLRMVEPIGVRVHR